MAIITFEQVFKRYRVNRAGTQNAREELVSAALRLLPRRNGSRESGFEEFTAVQDVSFQVERGETIGIIGANGSGKSTILKLLARITYPSSGRIAVFGSVASLIELGAGFHPELSGRENVYLYGSIMGMARADVRAKFDRIVEFAELERFIDTPVKRYSSGMYLRLGFGVAAHINPRVLLVDEVLAVGDAAFQSKCLRRIEELRRGGMTVVIVSHDMASIARLCSRVLFMHHGQLRAAGEPRQTIADYYNSVVFGEGAQRDAAAASRTRANQHLDRDAEILGVRFFNRDGGEIDRLATGETLVARIDYQVHRIVEDPVFELLFYAVDDRLQCHLTTALSGERIPGTGGRGVVEIRCDELGLTAGVFRVDAVITPRHALAACDRQERRYVLTVLPGKEVRGLFFQPHSWRLLPPNEPLPRVARSDWGSAS
jgi:lipopolysaccharide transport system ATP-binding protein